MGAGGWLGILGWRWLKSLQVRGVFMLREPQGLLQSLSIREKISAGACVKGRGFVVVTTYVN